MNTWQIPSSHEVYVLGAQADTLMMAVVESLRKSQPDIKIHEIQERAWAHQRPQIKSKSLVLGLPQSIRKVEKSWPKGDPMRPKFLAVKRDRHYHEANLFVGAHETALNQLKLALRHHRSQISRTPYDEIAIHTRTETLSAYKEHRQVADKVAGLEAFHCSQFQKGAWQEQTRKMITDNPIDKHDLLICVSPHPDDCEIGAGIVIQKAGLANAPTVVINATTGAHAPIATSSMNRSPFLKKSLGTSWDDFRAQGLAFIEDERIKEKIRHLESLHALKVLNKEIELHSLALPFYDRKYKITETEDFVPTLQKIKEIWQQHKEHTGRVIFLLPALPDFHNCHEKTTELFRSAVDQITPTIASTSSVELWEYMTPWYDLPSLILAVDHGFEGSYALSYAASEVLSAKSHHTEKSSKICEKSIGLWEL